VLEILPAVRPDRRVAPEREVEFDQQRKRQRDEHRDGRRHRELNPKVRDAEQEAEADGDDGAREQRRPHDLRERVLIVGKAALAIVGDFDPAEAKKFVEKYFGPLKASNLPPQPDLKEPRQEQQKRETKTDPLTKRPALAVAYHVPERGTPEYYAMILLDQILIEGDDSLLHQELVQKRGYAGGVEGGINLLGNPYNYQGPMLFIANLLYDPATKPDDIISAMDGVIEPLRTKPVDQKTLDRAKVKAHSDLYDTFGTQGGFGLMDILASFALFDDDPGKVNTLATQLDKVTPELLQKTAAEYLRPENRTVLVVEPKAAAAEPAAGAKP